MPPVNLETPKEWEIWRGENPRFSLGWNIHMKRWNRGLERGSSESEERLGPKKYIWES